MDDLTKHSEHLSQDPILDLNSGPWKNTLHTTEHYEHHT